MILTIAALGTAARLDAASAATKPNDSSTRSVRCVSDACHEAQKHADLMRAEMPAARAALVGPDGSASHSRGVREYQFDFLVRRQGLLRSETLLDLGCGVLRGGMPLINYLEPGHYWGLDVSAARLAEGRRELSERGLEHKRPHLVNSYDALPLSVRGGARQFDVIWSYQVFIHMTDDAASEAMRQAGRLLAKNGRFFLTAFIGEEKQLGSWLEFPVVVHPLSYYQQLAAEHGLQIEQLQRLQQDDAMHDASPALHMLLATRQGQQARFVGGSLRVAEAAASDGERESQKLQTSLEAACTKLTLKPTLHTDWRGQLLAEVLPRHGVGAEVGVWRGDLTVKLLSGTAPRTLHLIDPYLFQRSALRTWYGGRVPDVQTQADLDAIYHSTIARARAAAAAMRPQPEVVVHRRFSADALGDGDGGVAAASLDWIYIDGNHYFEHVLADMLLGWNKVRIGGLLTGDDLHWPFNTTLGSYPVMAGHGLPVTAALRQFLAVHARCAHLLGTCAEQFFVLKRC